MPLPLQLNWIRERFDPFSIVYLDSLICELASSTTRWSDRLTLGQSSDQKFVSKLLSNLKINRAEQVVATYLDPKGFGTRFKKDRKMQQRVTSLIEDVVEGNTGSIRRYGSLDQFYNDRSNLLSGDSPFEALMVLDTMFACRIILPQDMNQALPETVETHPRCVECVMIDDHPRLLTLNDRHIMLSVDRRAFYEWTEEFTKILSVGWHPFTRTIGFYTTSASGQPFVRVLAILMQPYPILSEVLSARGGAPAQQHLISELAANLATIKQILNTYQMLTTAASATGATAATTSTPAPSTTAPPRLTFRAYRRLMYPVYIIQMLCSLNGISSTGLQRRARPTYDLLQQYLEHLQKLHEYKQFLAPQVLEMAPPDGIEMLLEEPKRSNGQELALYE